MTVSLGDLTLATPVMTAAGCGGPELGRFVDLAALGAYVTRTITLDARPGTTGRRLTETPSGLLTELRLDNPGLHAFLAGELPGLAQQQVRTIVSITGRSLAEYAELARRAGGAPGVAGVEVSVVEDDPHSAGRAVSVVRREVPRGVAVLVKLPLGGRLLEAAREAAGHGVDALVVGHPHRGLVVDPTTLTPLHGALSGPATAPLALDAVWRLRAALPDVALVGVGGIRSGADALAMMCAGAAAVQVGTAVVHDPFAAHRIQAELTSALQARGLEPADVVGTAHHGPAQSSREGTT